MTTWCQVDCKFLLFLCQLSHKSRSLSADFTSLSADLVAATVPRLSECAYRKTVSLIPASPQMEYCCDGTYDSDFAEHLHEDYCFCSGNASLPISS